MFSQHISQIIFRADGNSQIGLGHIMRCLAISEMIGSSEQSLFIIQEPSYQVLSLLQQASFQVVSLPRTDNYQTDVDNFINYLNGNELVIIDGYSFEEQYQKTVKKHCWKLLAIDDLVNWHQYADVVINHGGNVQVNDYQAAPYTKFFLGTQYALLRKPFLEARRKDSSIRIISFYPQHILINLGGADPENISRLIVDILLNQTSVKQIVVILGAANLNADSFNHYTQQKVQIRCSLTPEQMVTAIQLCDLAIVSCSTISYEVATIGKPFIGILTAENQSALRDFYTANQIAVRVFEKNFTAQDLAITLSQTTEVINTSLTNQRHFFDGRSGERIAFLIKILFSTQ